MNLSKGWSGRKAVESSAGWSAIHHAVELGLVEVGVEAAAGEQVEVLAKYEGYIRRQAAQVDRLGRYDAKLIPDNFEYGGLPGLSREVKEKLARVRPRSVGQAGRIPGITPAAVAILLVALERRRRT